MLTLSAPPSTFIKRVFPFIALVGIFAWVYWSKRHEGTETLVVGLILLAIGSVLMLHSLRKEAWRRADVVEDRGDRLVVTRWKTTIEIPLSQVQEIMQVPTLGGTEVIIILKTTCAFGSEIAFFPPDKRKVPEIEYALAALSRRVSSQESKHAA